MNAGSSQLLSSSERVVEPARHRPPVRVPVDLGAHHVVSIVATVDLRLVHLHLRVSLLPLPVLILKRMLRDESCLVICNIAVGVMHSTVRLHLAIERGRIRAEPLCGVVHALILHVVVRWTRVSVLERVIRVGTRRRCDGRRPRGRTGHGRVITPHGRHVLSHTIDALRRRCMAGRIVHVEQRVHLALPGSGVREEFSCRRRSEAGRRCGERQCHRTQIVPIWIANCRRRLEHVLLPSRRSSCILLLLPLLLEMMIVQPWMHARREAADSELPRRIEIRVRRRRSRAATR